MHVAYKMEDINIYEGATLLFSSNNENNNNSSSIIDQHRAGSGGFQPLTKLSKRFLVWCYRNKDGDSNITESDTQMQPEMVPMDQLFRPEPPEPHKPKKKRARRKKA